MTIVFVSNYFNHHQKPISDSFYRVTNGEYWFIETTAITPWRKKMGYTDIEVPYTVKLNRDNRDRIIRLINIADIVITDAEYLELTRERYKQGKLTFRYSERLFKSKIRFLKIPFYVLKAYKTRNMHLLCGSAYAAHDYNALGFYRGKTYKWGYFPVRSFYVDKSELVEGTRKNSILWVGRLISWKHPESLIYVADRLCKEGYKFEVNIIGWGSMEKQLKKTVVKKKLEGYVNFWGAMSPIEVQQHMKESEIFLCTSDEGEGWGAVLNEAMNNGCATVAGDKIGAAPFLIQDGKNGFIFKNKNWQDLFLKVKLLLDNVLLRKHLAYNAIETINQTWNEDQAVDNFVKLSTALLSNNNITIESGPCSLA